MSGKRRIVTIPVDDERVTELEVVPWIGNAGPHGRPTRLYSVPVPSDDRLTRAMQIVWEAAGREALRQHMAGEPEHEAVWEARERVFRAFDLHSDDPEAFPLEEDEAPELDDVLAHGRARFGLGEGRDDE